MIFVHAFRWLHFSAPTSPPTNLTVEEFTSDSISLSWNPPPFEEQNGLIRQYFITITRNDTEMSFQQTSNATETTIQSVHPFSTYIIAVAAETIDVGPFTEGITVRLPEDGMWKLFYNLSRTQRFFILFIIIFFKYKQNVCSTTKSQYLLTHA